MVVRVSEPATAADRWWPSPFGPHDQLGMLNHIDDAKRREAITLVRDGRLYDLGHVLDERVPVFPGRYFRQTLVTTAHHAMGSWITETIAGTMQLGTHLDALSHLQIGDRGYNGWTVTELAGHAGVTRLGAETIPQIITCGWLVDVAPAGAADVLGPELLDGLDIQPGDAVLFHTGWGRHWEDPDAYLAGEPGPGMALGSRLAELNVAVTGCDTWSYGPQPPEDPARPFIVPQVLNAHHGVFVVENLDLCALAADGVRRFALILTHAKLRGATGAWTSPVALV
jgi:kynurenine formamidase